MTNATPDYFFNSEPEKSGRYSVVYKRSKSKETTAGTATFRKRASKAGPAGWDDLKNNYGRSAAPSYDSRDSKTYYPTVICWANG